MNLEITEKSKNPLLGRTLLQATISFENKTPSNTDVAKQIAQTLNTKEELVVMRNIYTKYGEHTASVKAYVYDTAEALKRAEIITRKKREADKKTVQEARQKAYEEKKAAE